MVTDLRQLICFIVMKTIGINIRGFLNFPVEKIEYILIFREIDQNFRKFRIAKWYVLELAKSSSCSELSYFAKLFVDAESETGFKISSEIIVVFEKKYSYNFFLIRNSIEI